MGTYVFINAYWSLVITTFIQWVKEHFAIEHFVIEQITFKQNAISHENGKGSTENALVCWSVGKI